MTRTITLIAACLSAWLAAAFPLSAAERPNIVLIMTDDQGYSDLGCYGAKDIDTPNVDRMAREGTRFTSFYAQPVCTASRAALLTGCYPNRLGLGGALNHTSPVGINPKEKLLSEVCKEQGYATGIFGKWHLGHRPPFLPTRRGFDEWFGLPYSNDNGPLHPVTPGIPSLPWYHDEKIVALDPDQSQFTQTLTKHAVSFIEKNKDRPFFLYLPHIMPHVPIFASEKFKGKSRRGLYGDVIQELDWSVGEVMAALKKHGLDEKTLVIYTSDNGPFLSYGEHAGSSLPLREGKLTLFDGGLRTPCVIRWQGHVPAGRVCDDMIGNIDLAMSLAHIVGGKWPDGVKRDGLDLTPLLLGEQGAKGRDTYWFYSGEDLHAVRQGDWKLHVPHDYLTVAGEPGKGGKPSNYGKLKPESIELSGVKGIASRHGYRIEKIELALYNVKDDLSEQINLAEKHPDIVRRLQTVAAEARADLGDAATGVPGRNVRPAGDIRENLPEGVRRIANLEYANPGKGALLLDLYLPEKAPARPLPVVLWIHGGGWSSGSKEKCPLLWMAAEGYAVASLDYRLTHEAQWPAQIDDCRAAVRWLRTGAAKYNLDPRHIGVGGGSAGGHLAALLGTMDLPKDEPVSSRVSAVCDFYGPADLLTMPNNLPGSGKTDADLAGSNGAKLLGGIVRDRPELAKQASPLHQTSKGDAPFLILHGDKDPQVPPEQSERLNARLREVGVESALHMVKGAGHGGKGFDTPEVRAIIKAFFDKHLRTND